jgi:hypothetical protein
MMPQTHTTITKRSTRPVMFRIEALAHTAGLADAHAVWMQLRQANGSGVAAPIDESIASTGNGVFWRIARNDDGRVYLRRPANVIAALEEMGQ